MKIMVYINKILFFDDLCNRFEAAAATITHQDQGTVNYVQQYGAAMTLNNY